METEKSLAIKVLLADDQALARRRVRTILERNENIEVVGEAGDGVEAVELAQKLSPHVVLMDIAMPVMNGIDAAKQIQAQNDQIRILMLTSIGNQSEIYAAFSSGAAGYCPKDIEPENLAAAIQALHAGEVFIAPTIASKILEYSNYELFCDVVRQNLKDISD
jgi:DNA-binding NarL/FixJ family response regulator